MGEITLNIAGISLSQECQDGVCLPDNFRKFAQLNKRKTTFTWRLQSTGVRKRGFSEENKRINHKILRLKQRFARFKGRSLDWRLKKDNLLTWDIPPSYPLSAFSFYANQPVFIDKKNRRINHFYYSIQPALSGNYFHGHLINYAYAQLLALNQGMLLHAAGVVKDKLAYLFLGHSGEGKSTVARLSRHYQVLGDDEIAVKKRGSFYLAFATPWKQASFIKLHNRLPARIRALFFLKKSKRVSFKPISPQEAMVRILMHHTHFLMDTEMPPIRYLFATCADLVKSVPAYLMEFRKNKNFWPELEKAING
jgi:hypothetical protein